MKSVTRVVMTTAEQKTVRNVLKGWNSAIASGRWWWPAALNQAEAKLIASLLVRYEEALMAAEHRTALAENKAAQWKRKAERRR